MENIDGREDPPVKGSRRSKKRYAVLWLAVLSLAMGVVFFLNWREFGAYLFYGRFLSNEVFYQRIKDTIKEGSPVSSPTYLRQKMTGGENEYYTVPGTKHLDSASMRHTIFFTKGDRVDVGLVRIRNGYNSPLWKYTFGVDEIANGKRRRLIEKTGKFPLDTKILFQIGEKLEGQDNGQAEIEYVIKPRGFRTRAGLIVARALKGPPYFKDFVFLTPSVRNKRKPGELNVILISFDTLRPDRLGCFGYPKPTSPNIDSFAEQSVLFTQAFSSSSWTLPAHFSLMTGLYPSAQLTPLEDVRKYGYHADRPIAAMLKDEGYFTVGVTGGLYLSSAKGFSLGFDQYSEFHFRNTDSTKKVFQTSMEWLEENSDIKFFMFLHNYECHFPYRNTQFLDKEKPLTLIEKRKALYDGGVKSADDYFGKLIEQLKSLDLLSKTLIVVVSDHGDDLHDHFTELDRIPRFPDPVPERGNKIDHGHSLYDEVIRVLMLFHLPGFEPKKHVLTNQVRLIDTMPTIMDYLGIQPDGPVQGTSLLGLMEEGDRSVDPPAISEFTLYGPERKSVRMDGYKYIYIPNPRQRKDGISFTDIPKYALFDLRKDPEEKNNIYLEKMELGKQYHQILEETLKESNGIKEELEAKKPLPEAGQNELPQDVVEALKAIGYLQ